MSFHPGCKPIGWAFPRQEAHRPITRRTVPHQSANVVIQSDATGNAEKAKGGKDELIEHKLRLPEGRGPRVRSHEGSPERARPRGAAAPALAPGPPRPRRGRPSAGSVRSVDLNGPHAAVSGLGIQGGPGWGCWPIDGPGHSLIPASIRCVLLERPAGDQARELGRWVRLRPGRCAPVPRASRARASLPRSQ